MLVELGDTVKYNWAQAELVGTSSVLSTEVEIEVVSIVFVDPHTWSILPHGPGRRIWSIFNGSAAPLYECLFTRIEL